MQSREEISFIKHNLWHVKAGGQEEFKRLFFEFFDRLEGQVKGMKGYAILTNAKDPQQMLILTFWQTQEDMNTFYNPNNKLLNELVEKSKPYLEQMPQRTDYKIVRAKF